MAAYTSQQVLQAFRPWTNEMIRRARSAGVQRGTYVSSFYRDARSNAEAGGAFESQHRVGLALDLVTPEDNWRLVDRMQRAGLVAVDEVDHVHVQLFPAGALSRAGVRFDLLP